MGFSRMIALFLGALLCLGVAEAQIVTLMKDGDKRVACLRSGLTSDLKDCGVQADWYTYVFIGSISSIVPVADGEKTLQLRPEEIFHGRPPSPLTVLTSQAACLPRLAVGDRWLFYLRKTKDKPIVLDYGGNDSLPVADAKEQIAIFGAWKRSAIAASYAGTCGAMKGLRGGLSPMRASSPPVRPEICGSLRLPTPVDAMNFRRYLRARTKLPCIASGHFGPKWKARM
jgi:hypothetical protein